MSGTVVKHDLKKFNVRFSLPEKITVQQTLQFWAMYSSWVRNREMLYVEMWAVIVRLGLIVDWECDYFSPETPLDEVFDPQVAMLVMEVCNLVFMHMHELRLRVTEKN